MAKLDYAVNREVVLSYLARSGMTPTARWLHNLTGIDPARLHKVLFAQDGDVVPPSLMGQLFGGLFSEDEFLSRGTPIENLLLEAARRSSRQGVYFDCAYRLRISRLVDELKQGDRFYSIGYDLPYEVGSSALTPSFDRATRRNVSLNYYFASYPKEESFQQALTRYQAAQNEWSTKPRTEYWRKTLSQPENVQIESIDAYRPVGELLLTAFARFIIVVSQDLSRVSVFLSAPAINGQGGEPMLVPLPNECTDMFVTCLQGFTDHEFPNREQIIEASAARLREQTHQRSDSLKWPAHTSPPSSSLSRIDPFPIRLLFEKWREVKSNCKTKKWRDIVPPSVSPTEVNNLIHEQPLRCDSLASIAYCLHHDSPGTEIPDDAKNDHLGEFMSRLINEFAVESTPPAVTMLSNEKSDQSEKLIDQHAVDSFSRIQKDDEYFLVTTEFPVERNPDGPARQALHRLLSRGGRITYVIPDKVEDHAPYYESVWGEYDDLEHSLSSMRDFLLSNPKISVQPEQISIETAPASSPFFAKYTRYTYVRTTTGDEYATMDVPVKGADMDRCVITLTREATTLIGSWLCPQ